MIDYAALYFSGATTGLIKGKKAYKTTRYDLTETHKNSKVVRKIYKKWINNSKKLKWQKLWIKEQNKLLDKNKQKSQIILSIL